MLPFKAFLQNITLSILSRVAEWEDDMVPKSANALE